MSYFIFSDSKLNLLDCLHVAFYVTVLDEFAHYQESIKHEANGLFVSEWKVEQSLDTATRLLQDTDPSFKGFVVICTRHIAEDLIRMVNILLISIMRF